MIGIYRIHNKKSNKNYVGQSIRIEHRLYEHLWALERGVHNNCYLQRAFNLDGVEVFEFSVLELCSKEELTDREQYWIDFYGGYNSPMTYNQKMAGNSVPCTAEIRDKLRRANGQKVAQYTLTGDIVSVYNSSAEAEEELNINGIRYSWDKIGRSAGGYMWRKVSPDKPIPVKIEPLKKFCGNSSSYEQVNVCMLSPNMDIIKKFKSLSEAERATGIKHQTISYAIKTGNLTKGYYWKRGDLPMAGK